MRTCSVLRPRRSARRLALLRRTAAAQHRTKHGGCCCCAGRAGRSATPRSRCGALEIGEIGIEIGIENGEIGEIGMEIGMEIGREVGEIGIEVWEIEREIGEIGPSTASCCLRGGTVSSWRRPCTASGY